VDENRTVNILRDEIGLEIERALAIDPAPDLKMRVLARIEHEPTSHPWWAPWRPLSAGAIGMAALMAMFIISSQREPDQGLQDEQAGAMRTVDLPSTTAGALQASSPIAAGVQPNRTRAATRVLSTAATMESAVLISPSETAGLRLLVASIRDGRIDPTVLDDLQPAGAPLEPLSEIAIQPITIEPLARLELLEGARQ
jgi:hypothetical protein